MAGLRVKFYVYVRLVMSGYCYWLKKSRLVQKLIGLKIMDLKKIFYNLIIFF